MPPSKARYVTACQQILALAVVLAVLAPAASVISLDVVRRAPGEQVAAPQGRAPAAPPIERQRATVETAPVDPVVTEVAMSAPVDVPAPRKDRGAQRPTAPAGGPPADEAHEEEAHEEDAHEDEAHEEDAHAVDDGHGHGVEGGRLAAISDVETVDGFSAVGVVWSSSEDIAQGDIAVDVRTQRDGVWSGWEPLDYSIDDGPLATSAEGQDARPGTEPLVVGEVDAVQARATTPGGEAPADLRLAVVEPGTSHGTAAGAQAENVPATEQGAGEAQAPEVPEQTEGTDDAIVLQAALSAPRPQIFTRAQWGADEKLRSGKPSYARVNAGVVHHTVTSNDYTEADVPKMIRSIYAYHTRSRGWSDIGYNFLVDRFGRVWEGRYGGVDKAVMGAHALNYNQYSFGVSALGNYDVKEPPKAMIKGIAGVMAWKLGIHGVDASSTSQKMGSKTFKAVIGHRDVGSTACPGRYLYAKLPNVRRKATRAQQGGTAPAPTPPPAPSIPVPVPAPTSNLVGSPYPDLVMRRASDQMAVILPTEGVLRLNRTKAFAKKYRRYSDLVATPDVTKDGRTDLVAREKGTGVVSVLPGKRNGKFAKPAISFPRKKFRRVDLLTAVGDLNGDRRNDLVGRKKGKLLLFAGTKKGGFKKSLLGKGFKKYDMLGATGDLTSDGRPDLVARDTAGRLWLFAGTGRRALQARRLVPGSFGAYDTITGFGDYNRDGRPDLFVRHRSNGAGYVLPSNGAGGFGHAHGPITGLKKLAKLSGGGPVAGGVGPDVVGRTKKGKLVVVRHTGRYDTSAPLETNMRLAGSDLVLNAGDWNGDRVGDVVIRKTDGGRLRLRTGNGDGTFASAVTLSTTDFGGADVKALGDLTGDGKPDLLVQSGSTVQIHPGNGTAALGDPVAAQPLPPVTGVDLRPYDWVVWTADVMLSGSPGLLVREAATGRLFAIQRDGSGGFRARRFLAEGLAGYDLGG